MSKWVKIEVVEDGQPTPVFVDLAKAFKVVIRLEDEGPTYAHVVSTEGTLVKTSDPVSVQAIDKGMAELLAAKG